VQSRFVGATGRPCKPTACPPGAFPPRCPCLETRAHSPLPQELHIRHENDKEGYPMEVLLEYIDKPEQARLASTTNHRSPTMSACLPLALSALKRL
jgi:hypothetical protein